MKIARIVLIALMLLSIIVFLISIVGDSHNPMLFTSYTYLIIAGVLALVSGISAIVSKGNFLRVIISLAIVGLVVLIAYLFSSDEVLKMYGDISSSTSRWSDVLLICMYICVILAIGSVAYSSVSRLLK